MSTSTAERFLRVAAGPGADFHQVIHVLSEAWSRQCIARLLEDEALLHMRFESILEFVDENLHLVASAGDSLRVGLGQMDSGAEQMDRRILQYALYLIALGAVGEFTLDEVQACQLYIDTTLFNASGRVVVTAGDAGCVVSMTSDCKTTKRRFVQKQGSWQCADEGEFFVVDIGTQRLAVFNRAVPHLDPELLGDLALSSSSQDEIRESLLGAAALIKEHHPACFEWCFGILRGVVFVTTSDGSTTSGSSSSHPGLIHVSHPISNDHLAAQIVHECAHQYLALVARHFRLTDADCQELYFSPFKHTDRPLYNVLLALHAAFNIRSFTRRALAGGCMTPYLISEDAQLVSDIDQMHRSIGTAPGLTAHGRTILDLMQGVCA